MNSIPTMALVFALISGTALSASAAATLEGAFAAARAAVAVRPAPPARPFPPLMMKVEGQRHSGGRTINLYVITLGDTTRQDEASYARRDTYQGIFARFAMDAAQYTRNADGTWRMWNLRPPKPEELDRWRAYLDRREVMDLLVALQKDPAFAEDFGAPGDFIHTRGHVPPAELPFPLPRANPQTLRPFLALFQYNEDQTMRLELADPDWEEGRAQVVFERLSRELSVEAH